MKEEVCKTNASAALSDDALECISGGGPQVVENSVYVAFRDNFLQDFKHSSSFSRGKTDDGINGL